MLAGREPATLFSLTSNARLGFHDIHSDCISLLEILPSHIYCAWYLTAKLSASHSPWLQFPSGQILFPELTLHIDSPGRDSHHQTGHVTQPQAEMLKVVAHAQIQAFTWNLRANPANPLFVFPQVRDSYYNPCYINKCMWCALL